MNMNGIVIIPVYQPESILPALVNEVSDNGNLVIVVDDGSSPDKQQIFWKLADTTVVLHHETNKGKGAAIKTALNYILENHLEQNYEIVGVMDGDGQHLPEDMETLMIHSREEKNALILGVRQVGKKMPLNSRLGNTITRKAFSILSGLHISDTQSGLRAFHTERIRDFLETDGERYEYETVVLYQCARQKIPIKEIPIHTIYKDEENSTSHFRTVRDSVRIYGELFKFVLSSLSSFCLDYLLFTAIVLAADKAAGMIPVANIMARLCSGTYNYLLNTKVVFHRKPSADTAVKYAFLAGLVLVFNNFFLSIYTICLHLDVFYAKIMTEITLFVLSFTVQKIWIFSKNINKDRNINNYRNINREQK